MKINMFLKGLALGVTFTAIMAWCSLYQNNRDWEKEAFKHYAGVYTFNAFNDKIEWMWFDDYAREVLLPKAKERAAPKYGTPSPLPKWDKI